MTKFIGNNITLPKLETAPPSPVSGDTYYNTTFNKPYTYNGTDWVDLTLTSATTGATGYWGSFWSTQDQSVANTTTAYPITFNNTDGDSSGVAIVSNSRVTFSYSGVYDIQFSAQADRVSGFGTDTIDIWFRKNGTDVPDSNTVVTVSGSANAAKTVAAWNYVVSVDASDYVELVWRASDTNLELIADSAGTSPTRPAVPSVILTVTQVMNTQVGPQGPAGPTGPAATPTAMNYAQTQGTKQSGISADGVTIVSTSITTSGYPVQVMVTGDAENSAVGAWVKLQLYRGSTAIGKIIHVEGSAGSENIPYALTVIDAPSAGTYTYALKTASAVAGGTYNFGETDGPVITALELTGGVGPTGATGPAVSLYSSTPTAISATGSAGSASTAARGDHTHEGVTSIAGTTNQVIASAADGPVTLSLPQSIGTGSNVTFNQVTASDYIALSGWNQAGSGRVGTSDTVTVTTAGTYYAIGGSNAEVSFTPDFVGQKFFITMTGYASLNTTTIQYAFVRVSLTDSSNTVLSDLGFGRSDNFGTSGRGGTVAFNSVWTSDTTSARKIKLYGTAQTTNGLVLTLAYWQLNVMALA